MLTSPSPSVESPCPIRVWCNGGRPQKCRPAVAPRGSPRLFRDNQLNAPISVTMAQRVGLGG